MPVVSTTYDIKSLIEHYAQIQVVSNSIVHLVEEFHSNCPWCGGTDRFITRPETGQYTCATRSSGCGKHGDALDFLKEYVGMSHQEAVDILNLAGTKFADEKPVVRRVNSSDVAPSKKWQEAAELILARAERYLFCSAPDAVAALAYLHSRGLTDKTIKDARIGYIPKRKLDYVPKDDRDYWHTEDYDTWGIDPETLSEKLRANGGVRIPYGIMIPHFVSGEIWKLFMRRPGAPIMEKGQILGSVDCLYLVDGLQYGDIAMVVEAELDALSVKQEAGDLINVVATGGSGKGHNKWYLELNVASFVLQSYDEDKSGDDGAEFWLETLPRIERWSTMIAHDPNDFLQAQLKGETDGLTLRQWVQMGVDLAKQQIAFEADESDHPIRDIPALDFKPGEHGWCAAGHVPMRVQYDDGDRSGAFLACPCSISELSDDDNPLAREVQEESAQIPSMGQDFLSDVEESEQPLPIQISPGRLAKAFDEAVDVLGISPLIEEPELTRDEKFLHFAESVSRFVNELGGPDKVTITKHDGRSLSETYPTITRTVITPIRNAWKSRK